MKTAAEIAHTLRWACHAATILAVLWIGGSAWPTPLAVTAICTVAGVDYLLAGALQRLADWLTSRTHV